MKYQGIIKQSRTFDAIALHSFATAMFPVLDMALPDLGLTVAHMAIYNILANAIMWKLRQMTTGPVGEK